MSDDPLFPPSRPRCIRQMAVGDGHILHVEESGPVDGLPVLFLHGGPGGGCLPEQRRIFDPARIRLIMIDQRGAGRSLPSGELEANTTLDLVADIEYVREALGIPGWIVFGGSWGSLLALAYAQIYPERLQGLVLHGIFLGSNEEIAAYVHGLSSLLPQLEQGDPLAAFKRRILGSDAETAAHTARVWLDYQRKLIGKAPLAAPPDAMQLARARIQMHYLSRDCFLMPGQLLAGIGRLHHLPAVIVQGMADPACPPKAAESLHRAWPDAIWVPVAGAGHDILSPVMARACIKALGWIAECVESFE